MTLEPIQYLLGALSGSLVGFTLGLVGGGGSILAVPLMVYLVRVPDAHLAIGTSAFAVAANAATGLIGHARANWLLLTGNNIDAAQALAWGLVDTVVPLDRLDDEVARLARQFAGYGKSVMRQQKRLLREWQIQPLEDAIVRGVEEFASAFATGEPRHHMDAFISRS